MVGLYSNLTIMTIILLGLAVKVVEACLLYVLPAQYWFNLIKITKGLNLHGSVISKLWLSGKYIIEKSVNVCFPIY